MEEWKAAADSGWGEALRNNLKYAECSSFLNYYKAL